MTVYEVTAAKIRELPEPLIQEVSDFIDFLQIKSDSTRWQLWILFNETLEFISRNPTSPIICQISKIMKIAWHERKSNDRQTQNYQSHRELGRLLLGGYCKGFTCNPGSIKAQK